MKPVLDINFAPDGSVVTAGMDGNARVITLPLMEIVAPERTPRTIFSAMFDETGQYVLTGSQDKSVVCGTPPRGRLSRIYRTYRRGSEGSVPDRSLRLDM